MEEENVYIYTCNPIYLDFYFYLIYIYLFVIHFVNVNYFLKIILSWK